MVAPVAPVQGKGFYFCRMLNCPAHLPVCRLLNHLRYSHNDALVEVKAHENNMNHFEVFGKELSGQRSSRFAYSLPRFGLFFLIFNVRKLSTNQTVYTAWIQCVCPNRAARELRFTLVLHVNNARITYTDYVSKKKTILKGNSYLLIIVLYRSMVLNLMLLTLRRKINV